MPEFDAFWNGAGRGRVPRHHGKELRALRQASARIRCSTRSERRRARSRSTRRTSRRWATTIAVRIRQWYEPAERLGGPTTKYKLHVAASHPKSRLHSQLCGTKLRDTYAVNGHEPCLINTKDAADRGIKDGDIVRVFNDRGQILAGAKVTDASGPA